SPSAIATNLILNSFNADSWMFLARAARDTYPSGINLAKNISHPESVWSALGRTPLSWFNKLKEDPIYSKQFTYMLFDTHKEVAKQISQHIDLKEFNHLMDLGGGSGVISMALLKKFPNLSAVIIDLPGVCKIGNEIAQEFEAKDRISYVPLDFLREDLPSGFDIILQCDSGIYSEELFVKIHHALLEGGKYLIIANLDIDSGWIEYPDQKLSIGHNLRFFRSALGTSKIVKDEVKGLIRSLNVAGFRNTTYKIVSENILIIQAHKSVSG
ncbi:MAG: methyltransferase, partial [Candidatus Hodarchaeales archaeon]